MTRDPNIDKMNDRVMALEDVNSILRVNNMTKAQIENLTPDEIAALSDQDLAGHYQKLVRDPKADMTTVDWLEGEMRDRWLRIQQTIK